MSKNILIRPTFFFINIFVHVAKTPVCLEKPLLLNIGIIHILASIYGLASIYEIGI